MEAIAWRRPAVWRRFGVKSQEQADESAFQMANQGYYNLFLGIGAVVGSVLVLTTVPARTTLLGFCCLFMVGAGVVLFALRRSMVRAAVIQAGPPLAALLALMFV